MDGIDNDMSVNGLCVRMRCDHTLTIREGFFRIAFSVLFDVGTKSLNEIKCRKRIGNHVNIV